MQLFSVLKKVTIFSTWLHSQAHHPQDATDTRPSLRRVSLCVTLPIAPRTSGRYEFFPNGNFSYLQPPARLGVTIDFCQMAISYITAPPHVWVLLANFSQMGIFSIQTDETTAPPHVWVLLLRENDNYRFLVKNSPRLYSTTLQRLDFRQKIRLFPILEVLPKSEIVSISRHIPYFISRTFAAAYPLATLPTRRP